MYETFILQFNVVLSSVVSQGSRLKYFFFLIFSGKDFSKASLILLFRAECASWGLLIMSISLKVSLEHKLQNWFMVVALKIRHF